MPDRPNLLIILSDQLRRCALGCYGDPNVSTPHIDALARRGVAFRHACSTYPICVPFRFTLMTGLYAHTRQVPGIDYRMSPAERTLADAFNEGGYDTIYVGKWHLNGGAARGRPEANQRLGRERIAPDYQGRWAKWLGFELRNGPFDTWVFEDDAEQPTRLDGYQTDGLCDLAMTQLAQRQTDRPFCCVLSVEPPHPPFEAPDEDLARWRERAFELRPNFVTDHPRADYNLDVLRKYYAMVENLDRNVGRVTAFLDEQGLADNTVVVFLSDHGELAGSHGLEEKQYPQEESTGIPLIVVDPRGRHGAWVDDPVHAEDLYPTLLGLAGLAPEAVPGIDLAPLVRGAVDRLERDGVLLEFVAETRPNMPFYADAWRGWRERRWKYTVHGGWEGRPWQLFDLDADPYELDNLVERPEYAGEVKRCHERLRQELAATGDDYRLVEW